MDVLGNSIGTGIVVSILSGVGIVAYFSCLCGTCMDDDKGKILVTAMVSLHLLALSKTIAENIGAAEWLSFFISIIIFCFFFFLGYIFDVFLKYVCYTLITIQISLFGGTIIAKMIICAVFVLVSLVLYFQCKKPAVTGTLGVLMTIESCITVTYCGYYWYVSINDQSYDKFDTMLQDILHRDDIFVPPILYRLIVLVSLFSLRVLVYLSLLCIYWLDKRKGKVKFTKINNTDIDMDDEV
jgi:hypothetical protein